MSEKAYYSSKGQITERVNELKKVISRLHKHGPLLEKQKQALISVVTGMENILERQAD